MPSIPMPAVTAPEPVTEKAPPIAPDPPPPRRVHPLAWLGGGALATLAIAALAMLLVDSAADDARELLEEGKAAEALEVLDQALKKKSRRTDPELLALRAAALHRLDRHRDELVIFRERLAPKSPELLDPVVLSGLLEDFGRDENGPSGELLERMPREALYAALKDLATRAAPEHRGPPMNPRLRSRWVRHQREAFPHRSAFPRPVAPARRPPKLRHPPAPHPERHRPARRHRRPRRSA